MFNVKLHTLKHNVKGWKLYFLFLWQCLIQGWIRPQIPPWIWFDYFWREAILSWRSSLWEIWSITFLASNCTSTYVYVRVGVFNVKLTTSQSSLIQIKFTSFYYLHKSNFLVYKIQQIFLIIFLYIFLIKTTVNEEPVPLCKFSCGLRLWLLLTEPAVFLNVSRRCKM